MYKKIINKILGPQTNTKDILSLHKTPVPESEYNDVPHFQDFIKNNTHQADLLFLPTDKGYKYLLVCVDNSTRLCDAEPLKNKVPEDIVKAFKSIYKRKILKVPKNIELDKGTEFKGETSTYFKKLGVNVHYAETNRHRQQALVEGKNHFIGKAIFMLQNHEELTTGKQSTTWLKFLPDIIKGINEHVSETRVNDVSTKPLSDFPVSTNYNEKLLSVGTPVRILLDHPIEVFNKKRLGGAFRAGDIRWSLQLYKIKDVLLRPGFPPLYTTTNNDHVQHTKQQLQVVLAHHFV